MAQSPDSHRTGQDASTAPVDLQAYLKCKAKAKSQGLTDLQAHLKCRGLLDW